MANRDDDLAYGEYHGQQGQEGQEGDRGFLGDTFRRFAGIGKLQGAQQQQQQVCKRASS
jgi:phospholipase D1/2